MTDICSWEDCAQELGRIESGILEVCHKEQDHELWMQGRTPRMDSMGVHEARLPRVPSSMALLEHVLCMDTCFIYIIWLHANRPISDKK